MRRSTARRRREKPRTLATDGDGDAVRDRKKLATIWRSHNAHVTYTGKSTGAPWRCVTENPLKSRFETEAFIESGDAIVQRHRVGGIAVERFVQRSADDVTYVTERLSQLTWAAV